MNSPVDPTPPVAPPLWRTYLALLLPMLLTNALQLAAGTLDNLYLGQLLGTQAVAVAAAFFPVFFLLLALVMGLATGAMVLIGQAWGAGRPQQVRAVAGSAVALILLLSVLVMALGSGFTPQLLMSLGTPAPILGESIVYARVLLLAAPAFFLLWLATAVSRAVGDAKTPLHALLLATAVGMLCTPLLILGWAGLPQLGSASAAVSAAIASLLAWAGCCGVGIGQDIPWHRAMSWCMPFVSMARSSDRCCASAYRPRCRCSAWPSPKSCCWAGSTAMATRPRPPTVRSTS